MRRNVMFSDNTNPTSHCEVNMSNQHNVTFREKRFDIRTLPEDMQRVYQRLESEFGEHYALTFVFMARTAQELHRAWHMTLLTSEILQQIKDKFKIRATWDLGVIKLKFRVEDGGYQLHRKVPYDYDSEFQDLYTKIAVAYVEGRIDIHQALNFQSDAQRGKHTAASGLFLRDFPGRLLLYPLQAATCAVIFFSGDWFDAGVAAVCGVAAGIIEYALVSLGHNFKLLIDVTVGLSTGAIAGLFYSYAGQKTCMPAIFLGVLYWFFYGTAFVIGILEIIAGELETGVVRFMAVSVKTFVLTLGTTFGMQLTLENSIDAYRDQNGNCGNIDLDTVWWRIPLYLLCSASALGQYRFPIVHYWRGLAVQLVGYEVQYQLFKYYDKKDRNDEDLIDTAVANLCGAAAAVIFVSILTFIIDGFNCHYNARVLNRDEEGVSKLGEFLFSLKVFSIRLWNWIRLGRKNDVIFLDLNERLKQENKELCDPHHPRTEITLTENEESVLLEAIVDAEVLSIWAILMPTVYQLVPGSLIAKLWFNVVFPPSNSDESQEAVFENLMVVATSLALGLLIGNVIVEGLSSVLKKMCPCLYAKSERKMYKHRFQFNTPDDDPESVRFVGSSYDSGTVDSQPSLPSPTEESNRSGRFEEFMLKPLLS